jgi:hypothetical protein
LLQLLSSAYYATSNQWSLFKKSSTTKTQTKNKALQLPIYLTETKFKMAAIAAILDEWHQPSQKFQPFSTFDILTYMASFQVKPNTTFVCVISEGTETHS